MDNNQANIDNLTSLWKRYGAQQIASPLTTPNTQQKIHSTEHWPNRCWLEPSTNTPDYQWIEQIPKTAIVPVWPMFNSRNEINNSNNSLTQFEQYLQSNNWHCVLTQTAMYLSLNQALDNDPVKRNQKISVKQIDTASEIDLWLEIASDAFGYTIDRSVITQLVPDNSLQLLLALDNEQAVATALLYKTGDTIGIHQVGVKRCFQGKGIARHLMETLLIRCQNWQGKRAVLQASSAGLPLYQSLGFTPQFAIKSYQLKNQ